MSFNNDSSSSSSESDSLSSTSSPLQKMTSSSSSSSAATSAAAAMQSTSSSSSTSPPSPTVTITVRTLTGQSMEVTVGSRDTVGDLKARLATELSVFVDQQHLVHAGREIVSGSLGDLGITNGSTVTLATGMHSGPLYAAKRTSLFGKHDLSAILRTLSEDQIAFLLSQKKPVTVTTRIGDQLVVFTLMPSEAGDVADDEVVDVVPAAAVASAAPVVVAADQQLAADQASPAAPTSASSVRRGSQSALVTTHRAHHHEAISSPALVAPQVVSESELSHHSHHHHHHHEETDAERRERRRLRHAHHHSHHHLSTPEKLKEHKRRKEAQREQRKRNEVLKMKVSFLLEQMREKKQEDDAPALLLVPEQVQVQALPEEIPSAPVPMELVTLEEVTPAPVSTPPANRCFACNKKLGLASNFKCKCEHVFCSAHRWESSSSDSKDGHACTFDFKAHGRQLLREANPLVKKTL